MAKKKTQSKKARPRKKKTDENVASNSTRIKKKKRQSHYAVDIAARLALLADRVGSRAKLDEALGVGRGTMASYLRKPHRVPGGEMLFKLCDVTGCGAEWLLTGRGEPFPEDRTVALTAMEQRLEELLASLRAAIESTHL